MSLVKSFKLKIFNPAYSVLEWVIRIGPDDLIWVNRLLILSLPPSQPPKLAVNTYEPNGTSHFYQLDRSISVLRVVGWYFFIFYSNFYIKFCKQTVETLIRCCILWCLIWVCTVCLCPTKRTLGLYGLTLHLLDNFTYILVVC